MISTLLLLPLMTADLPTGAAALQEQIRSTIEKVEPGVVAIVVSTNPAYPALPAKSRPGTLGAYTRVGPLTDGIVPAQRDKLDLADPRSATDNTFGSGLLLDRSRFVLTTWHLIEGARKIYVRFSNGQGSYADVHAADARSDLAVLRLITPVEPRTPVKFAKVQTYDSRDQKANVFRGQLVLAAAHPYAAGFSDGKCSVASGMISNIRRRSPMFVGEEQPQGYLHQYANLLQTDARIALGSSGGALFNLDGEAMGLLTATAAIIGSETGGGYALPFDGIYRRIIDVLLDGGEVEYGFLGISPGQMIGEGLRIERVSGNSPASAAGLQPFDHILSIDGRPLTERDDLFLLVGGSLAGRTVELEIKRNSERFIRKAKLAKFANELPSIASQGPEAVLGLRVDHSSLLAQRRVFFGENRDLKPGVVIRDVDPESPAAAKLANFKDGMIITHVNDTAISTPEEFYRLARGAKRLTLSLASTTDPRDTRTVTLP